MARRETSKSKAPSAGVLRLGGGEPRAGEGVLRPIVIGLAFASLVSLGLEHGFEAPALPLVLLRGVQIATVAAYLLAVVVRCGRAASLHGAMKAAGLDIALILVGAVVLAGEAEFTRGKLLELSTVYIGTLQVLLVLRFLGGAVRWNLEMSRKPLHPSRLVMASFLVLIVVGGCLLALPKAVTPAVRAQAAGDVTSRVVKSLFTATSATCVTGLVVYDTGQDFTRFGQIVILVLIQVGGLGIMIFASLFGLMAGKQLSLRQSLVLQDELSRQTVGRMGSAIRFIVATTFLCEAVGAVLCYPMFAGTVEPFGERVFHCVFHAISAFCNAGFALPSDSLIGYRGAWGVYVAIMPLIVVGGLGFPVLQDLWGWLGARFRRAAAPHEQAEYMVLARTRVRTRYHLRLHTKLVLASSAALIVGPAALFFAFETLEWRGAAEGAMSAGAMAQMSGFERCAAALFQSVTARTAGFNTAAMDIASLSPASHFLLLLLMFVGGSPASAAGGVKTVTLAVLVLGVMDTLRRREDVEAFGRRIPEDIIRRAAVVVTLMFALVSTAVLALTVTEAAPFTEILFEVVSACGTVGLSTGLTGRLTTTGELIIMVAMFAGRLGPLTLMIALTGRKSPARYAYPQEPVTIG